MASKNNKNKLLIKSLQIKNKKLNLNKVVIIITINNQVSFLFSDFTREFNQISFN